MNNGKSLVVNPNKSFKCSFNRLGSQVKGYIYKILEIKFEGDEGV